MKNLGAKMTKKKTEKQSGLLNLLRRICNSRWFDFVLDFLLVASLLFHDISEEKIIFGTTPPYKYLLIVFGFLLAVDYLVNKRKLGKKGWILLGGLAAACVFSVIVCRGKTVVVPSVFLLVEVAAFILYINRVKKADIQRRIFRIVLSTSLVLAVLGLVQVFAFRAGIKEIYLPLTQNMNYLHEGRMTSIYSEPAHLCALLGGGIFICLYSLLREPKIRHYIYLAILALASLFSGSVITYGAVAICVAAFFVYYFVMRKEKGEKHSWHVLGGLLACLVVSVLYFTLLASGKTLDAMNNKIKSLSSAGENYGATTSVEENQEDERDNKDEDEQQNEETKGELPPIESIDKYDSKVVIPGSAESAAIVREQVSHLTSYAIKSNINIGLEKTKKGHLLGTGIFSHILFYDQYMRQIYPNGYARINFTDACSIVIRVLSEFGIVGLTLFAALLIYTFVRVLKRKEIFEFFLFAIFIAQSMRLGGYNWVLTCFSFVYLMLIVAMPGIYNCSKARTSKKVAKKA